MGLPKIDVKWHKTKIKSNGKSVTFRPFTIGEQKQIMMIKATDGSDANTYQGVMSMIQHCVEKIEIDKLSIPDFEGLFYDIRSVSDGNLIDVNIECSECKNENLFSVNCASDFHVKNDKNLSIDIEITEGSEPMIASFLQPNMKVATIVEKKPYGSDEEKVFDVVAYCLTKVTQGEQVHRDFKHQDAVDFLDQLPDSYLKKLKDFFENTPSLVLTEEIKCSSEECEHVIVKAGSPAKNFLS